MKDALKAGDKIALSTIRLIAECVAGNFTKKIQRVCRTAMIQRSS